MRRVQRQRLGGPWCPAAAAFSRCAPLGEALAAVDATRKTEGEALVADLRGMCDRLEAQLGVVREALPAALAAWRERLEARVQKLMEGVSLEPEALAREVAIAADKGDVSEEVARIDAHLEAVRATLATGGPCGRRLEFLAQELQRETSTLSAKLQDARLVQAALDMKLEVGRMREQTANVE